MKPSHDAPDMLHGYTLVRLLGQGTFGEVWEARAPGDFPAALKFIRITRSQAEVRLELDALESIKKLKHPHLLPTYACWSDPDQVVIAMELADGTLRQRLEACRQQHLAGIPPEELVHYTREAALALDYLHHQNKLHRDIKPDNILLFNGSPPHVKVGDCGLLREQGLATATMTTMGTPPYIAPEVWRRTTLPASDQYSLAVTYAELRQGRRPLEGTNPVLMAEAHLLFEPDLAGLEMEERQVIQKALSKDPQQRFASCVDLVRELERVLNLQTGRFRPPGSVELAPGRAPQPVRPRPMSKVPTLEQPSPLVPSGNSSLQPYGSDTDQIPSLGDHEPRGWKGQPAATQQGVSSSATLATPQQQRQPRPRPHPWAIALAIVLVLGGAGLAIWPLVSGGGNHEEPKDKDKVVEVKDLDRGKRDREKDDGQPKKDPKKDNAQGKDDRGKARDNGKDTGGPKDNGKDSGKPDFLPVGFEPDPGQKVEKLSDGRLLYPRIRRLDERKVVFLLIRPRPEGKPPNPPAFYLMENKVWNALYQAFSEAKGEERSGKLWRLGGRAAGKDVGIKDPHLPVLRVTREEAKSCAEWLGGDLPTVDQLDRAAGLGGDTGDREGPARGTRVAVGRREQGPRDVFDEKSHDVSPEGIRDLAGNGWEWTRNTLDVDGETLSVLRGRSYTLAGPLLFKMLQDQRNDRAPSFTQYPSRATPATGFRVVLEIPPRK